MSPTPSRLWLALPGGRAAPAPWLPDAAGVPAGAAAAAFPLAACATRAFPCASASFKWRAATWDCEAATGRGRLSAQARLDETKDAQRVPAWECQARHATTSHARRAGADQQRLPGHLAAREVQRAGPGCSSCRAGRQRHVSDQHKGRQTQPPGTHSCMRSALHTR